MTTISGDERNKETRRDDRQMDKVTWKVALWRNRVVKRRDRSMEGTDK